MPYPTDPRQIAELSPQEARALRAEAVTALARKSLHAYLTEFVWPCVEPTRPFVDGWHIGYLCELLEAVSYRQLRFLLINWLPRNCKSTIASLAWPTWDWLRGNPGARYICGSYSEDLRNVLAEKRRQILQSPQYQAAAPDALLVKLELESQMNVSGGHIFATMTGGTVAGFGGNILLDDPQNIEWADSDARLHASNRWITKNFSSRFDDNTCAFVVLQQRIAANDATDYLLRRGVPWTHIVIDALPDAPQTYLFPRSGRIVTQNAGEPVCHQRQDVEELRLISRLLDGGTLDGKLDFTGPNFMAQYRQRPRLTQNSDGVQRAWWRFWHYPGSSLSPVEFPSGDAEPIRCACIPLPADEELEAWCQSWDLSQDATARAADTAGGVFARKGQVKFMLDLDARPMDYMAQLDAMAAMQDRWPQSMSTIYVEKAGNGAAVMSAKGADWPGLVPIEKPTRSKEERLKEVLPNIRSGECVLPHPDIAPWSLDVVQQCALEGKKRDVMDIVTQALKQMRAPSFAFV